MEETHSCFLKSSFLTIVQGSNENIQVNNEFLKMKVCRNEDKVKKRIHLLLVANTANIYRFRLPKDTRLGHKIGS